MTGSLLALIVANFFLILFVAGADVFLGQPPQLMVPLFALMLASGALMFSRRRRAQVESHTCDVAFNTKTIPVPGSQQRQLNVPAYVSMTIIRRPPVIASAEGKDNWKGAIQ
ncbi:MAG: hypothetical protein WBV94_23490 [Blastocatellia bacterium]